MSYGIGATRMARIFTVVGALLIVAAVVLVSAWVGRMLERAAARRDSSDLDADTYRELIDFTRHALGAQPLEDPAYIPAWLKAKGMTVLAKTDHHNEEGIR